MKLAYSTMAPIKKRDEYLLIDPSLRVAPI